MGENKKRKLKYTLQIIEEKGSKVGVNTHLTNKIVGHALQKNLIKDREDFAIAKGVFTNSSIKNSNRFVCDRLGLFGYKTSGFEFSYYELCKIINLFLIGLGLKSSIFYPFS